jgi:hypothetical protein
MKDGRKEYHININKYLVYNKYWGKSKDQTLKLKISDKDLKSLIMKELVPYELDNKEEIADNIVTQYFDIMKFFEKKDDEPKVVNIIKTILYDNDDFSVILDIPTQDIIIKDYNNIYCNIYNMKSKVKERLNLLYDSKIYRCNIIPPVVANAYIFRYISKENMDSYIEEWKKDRDLL